MKKNLFGIVILIVLAALAYFLFFEETTILTSEDQDFKDFAIEDTSSIDKIFLSQPNGKKLLLSRRETGVWMVNNSFPARMDAVELILRTALDVKVLSPVSKKSFESVVKRLATGSTKVEYYQGEGEPVKTWYIGDATASRMGTYMLLEKEGVISSKPYVTHRLMERGYLGTRFFMDPLLWKDRVMMKCNPMDIASVEVKHQVDSLISFRIDQVGDAEFEITNLETNETSPLGTNAAIPYLNNFEGVYYKYIDKKRGQAELDSIYNSLPRHEIYIRLKNGKKIEMRTYNMPVMPGSTFAGKPIDYHPERMYSFTTELGDKVHPIVQNLTFDVLLPSFKDFQSLTTVEK